MLAERLRPTTTSFSAAVPKAPQRWDIQGLRAVAVLLVVLNHAGISFLKGGYIGVDVFFVLSGFLITGLLVSSATKPRLEWLGDFYARRARRILPAAALTLLVTDIVTYQLLNFVRAKQVLQDSISASLFTVNFHFAAQGTDYFSRGQPPSPIQHFWSLSVEEQFYVVWPLLLSLVLIGFALHRRSRRGLGPAPPPSLTARGRRRLLVAVVVIAGVSLGWSIYYTHDNQVASYFSTFSRAWELALGATLAVLAGGQRRIPDRWRAMLGWVGLAAIGAAAVLFSSSTEFPGYAALLPTVGAALVIAAGIGGPHPRFAAGRVLGVAPMRFIGDRSYAFYLWHWPALTIAAAYVGHSLSLGVNLGLLAGAFALSVVSYGLIENPIRHAQWSASRRALILWPASLLAVLIVAGSQIGQIDVKATRLADAGASLYPGLNASFDTGVTGTTTSAPVAPPVPVVAPGSGGALPAVVAAGRAAQKAAPIPAALTPPVAGLLADHYTPPSGCAANDGQSTSTICALGDTAATRTMVVLGDSQAQMWLPALIKMADQDGWIVKAITKSSCTPGGWYLPQYHRTDCANWFNWAQKQIASLHPAVTLIAGDLSTLYIARAPTVATGLAGLVGSLKHGSPHVLVFQGTPLQQQEPVDCLLRSHATMSTCAVALTSDQLTVSNEIGDAVRGAGGRYVLTRGWFCYQDTCPMVIGNTIAYRDHGHVSVTYVDQLEPVVRRAVRRAIGLPVQPPRRTSPQ